MLCDPALLQSAVTQLVLAVLGYGEGDARLEVGLTGPERGEGEDDSVEGITELTVVVPGSRIPAAELGRIITRFHRALRPAGEPDPDDGAAAVRVVAGAVTAETRQVRARSSAEGSVIRVRWPLHEQEEGAPALA